jgi:hypothetical protein
MWQETRDPACKTAVNWVRKQIRRMIRKKALETWETKTGNCEVTHRRIWPTAKSLLKRDGPRAPTAIHGPFGRTFFFRWRKPMQLLTARKTSSHHINCVTKTMKGG